MHRVRPERKDTMHRCPYGRLIWAPTQFFILMAGPLGLLLYLAVRWLSRRQRGQN
jgi:hypothetical protein